MTALVRAEFRKIGSTRMWWGLLLGLVFMVALQVVASVFAAGQSGAPSLEDPGAVRNVFTSIAAAAVFPLVLGIIGMAGEYRHMTVTSTFLVTPRRWRVIAAKLVAYLVAGLGYALVGTVVGVPLALWLLDLRDASASAVDLGPLVLGIVVTLTLYAVIGVGVGALVPNQVAALLGALLWVFIVESLLVAFLPEIGSWTPGGAANAMLGTTAVRGELLPPWAGGLLFLGYGLVLAAAGARATARRDIT
jgi:ABC-2 type transport system permease protein